jgi:hypothetical protein
LSYFLGVSGIRCRNATAAEGRKQYAFWLRKTAKAPPSEPNVQQK